LATRGVNSEPEYIHRKERALMAKLLRKLPSEIDKMDVQDFKDIQIVLKELGDKNPLIWL